jgi:hypothetical protein
MSATKESLENLFKGVAHDGRITKLSSNELDEIRSILNDTTCGTNIIYCENPKAPPILSHVFKNGVQLDSDNPHYDKERLVLSSNPNQDSIKIAKEDNFANHSVGKVVSSDLQKIVPTYKNGESSYLILDRYPKNSQIFLAIVQADPLLDTKKQRHKLLQVAYESVCLYLGNKKRSCLSHPSQGYQFFVGNHKKYRTEIGTYRTRPAGVNCEVVSLRKTFSM